MTTSTNHPPHDVDSGGGYVEGISPWSWATYQEAMRCGRSFRADMLALEQETEGLLGEIIGEIAK